MFGMLNRPQGNDSPAEEAKETVTLETPEVETTSESVADKTAEEDTTQEATTQDEGSEDQESSDAETDDGDDTETDEVKKPSKGIEKKFKKFTQRLASKDQEIEYWKKAAMGNPQGNQSTQTQTAIPDKKPVFADYNDLEAFTEASIEYGVKKALAETGQRQQVDNVIKTYETRVKEFSKVNPDFNDVMNEFQEDYGNMQCPEIVQVAMESEVGPALAYYLASNTDEVDRIVALPPYRRLIELGKLEDKVAKPATKPVVVEAKKISKAAPPIEAVKGSTKVANYDLRSDDDYEVWVKKREASLRK